MNKWQDRTDLFAHFNVRGQDDMNALSKHFNWNDLIINIIEDNDVIAVCVQLVVDANNYESISVTGSSRREPGDRFDREVGLNLAMGRAFVRLGEKLVKRGMGKSNHNDWVKSTKAKLEEKKQNSDSSNSAVNSIAAAVGYVFKK